MKLKNVKLKALISFFVTIAFIFLLNIDDKVESNIVDKTILITTYLSSLMLVFLTGNE